MRKPGWGFWAVWAIVYTVLDLVIEAAWHGGLRWSLVSPAVKDALLGATITWFFALWRWYRVQDRF